MRKKILTSMLLFSTTLFAMDHSNHNMQHHNTNEVANQYEKWIATIKTEKESFYFDGVKDMMKFYFEPTKYIKNADLKNSTIKVTDYYTLEQIDAKNAFFVIGSNVMGPMGDELIPFKDENSANEFSKDHFGKKILKFNEITLDTLPKKHH